MGRPLSQCERIRDARRLLTSTVARDIYGDVAKALYLIETHKFSITVAATATNTNKSKVARAMIATKNNRIVGKSGRPRSLTGSEEAAVVKEIRKRHAERNSMTIGDILTLVSNLLCSLVLCLIVNMDVATAAISRRIIVHILA